MDPRVAKWLLFFVLGGVGYFFYKCAKVNAKKECELARIASEKEQALARIAADKECELARIAAEQARATEEAQLKALDKVKHHTNVTSASETLLVQALSTSPLSKQRSSSPPRRTPTRRPPKR